MPRSAVIGLVVGVLLAGGAWLAAFAAADPFWPAIFGGTAWLALGAIAGSILGSLISGGPSRSDDEADEDEVPGKPTVPGPVS